jgi:hypothetical protein
VHDAIGVHRGGRGGLTREVLASEVAGLEKGAAYDTSLLFAVSSTGRLCEECAWCSETTTRG